MLSFKIRLTLMVECFCSQEKGVHLRIPLNYRWEGRGLPLQRPARILREPNVQILLTVWKSHKPQAWKEQKDR